MNDWGFTPRELRVLRGVKTPSGVQDLLDAMPYHLGDTAWSPRRVLGERATQTDIDEKILAVRRLPWSEIVRE